MTLEEYRQLFTEVLEGRYTQPPYDDPAYQNYLKLNSSRMKRWTKEALINKNLEDLLKRISAPQQWVVITEPWCGDAANILPFFEKMAAVNTQISVQIQLRDSNSEIDQYLTNGGRSIPILVVRDAQGKDLFVWGPRPAPLQALALSQKGLDIPQEEKYAAVLKLYRKDNGEALQAEIGALLVPTLIDL